MTWEYQAKLVYQAKLIKSSHRLESREIFVTNSI